MGAGAPHHYPAGFYPLDGIKTPVASVRSFLFRRGRSRASREQKRQEHDDEGAFHIHSPLPIGASAVADESIARLLASVWVGPLIAAWYPPRGRPAGARGGVQTRAPAG